MKKYLPEIDKTPLIEKIPSSLKIEDVYNLYQHQQNSALLNSSLSTDVGRYSFIGLEPFLTIKTKGTKVSIQTIDNNIKFNQDPFEVLKTTFETYDQKNPTSFPFTSGGIGYFSYNIKDLIEKLPQKATDDLGSSDIYMNFYQALLIKDNSDPDHLYISTFNINNDKHKKRDALCSEIKDHIRQAHPIDDPGSLYVSGDIESNFTKESYTKAIRKVIDYILAGDIYQACLSQRFKSTWRGLPYRLYSRLNEISPAPFSAYLNFGDSKIISSSPELFLRLSGNTLETRPMKGTRPRGQNSTSDEILKKDLEKSQKDAAELAMIVDLERNDLGKVSIPGTVEVAEHRRIEEYRTVFQTISVVKSTVSKDTNLIDIIKSTFPGGSISGCPKIRAMEIIDELEPTARGVYTGSIGYISFHNSMDLNIAIRTMVLKDKDVYFQVGGGIVADSDPLKEYEETLHKARAMIKALEG